MTMTSRMTAPVRPTGCAIRWCRPAPRSSGSSVSGCSIRRPARCWSATRPRRRCAPRASDGCPGWSNSGRHGWAPGSSTNSSQHPPSGTVPAQHPGNRGTDRSTDSHRDRRRHPIPHRRSPRRLRRPRPVTEQSGRSIDGEHRSRRGNHRLENALWLSAFCSLHSPASTRLLRPQTLRGQEAQRRNPLPRPAPLQPIHKMLNTGLSYGELPAGKTGSPATAPA